ncbi:MAG: nuclease [Spartobacteria bacterium]|nr:nuclease [Spartobacteria bacterium]
MKKSLITIRVDIRENRSGVPDVLEGMEAVCVVRETLKTGDYLVDDLLVVERKTCVDFAQSIIDGRLFQQAERLAVSRYQSALILEGTDFAATHMSREAIQGALISLSLIWGIPLLRSMHPRETARLLVYAGRQMQWMRSGGIKRAGYRPKTKKKRQLFILQGLPGVGPERAERLLDHYGSVAGVMSASVNQLSQLDGMGRKTAERIVDAVHESRAGYGAD